jgi:hypothetical protein
MIPTFFLDGTTRAPKVLLANSAAESSHSGSRRDGAMRTRLAMLPSSIGGEEGRATVFIKYLQIDREF